MTEVKSLDQLSLVLGYIVPGLIIIWVRAQFLTGRVGANKDSVLGYFAVSAIYLLLLSNICTAITGINTPLNEQTRYWQVITLGGAVVFGGLVGLNASFGWSRRFLRKCGFNIPHVLDSAWDWKFSRTPPSLVMLRLKDGSTVAGWCGPASFIGSTPKDRDMYVEQVYDVDKKGNWTIKTNGKSIYIASGELRSIEFIPIPLQ